jgi:uncharacterized membrane protein YdjX (TVP38/TMEM64 family)
MMVIPAKGSPHVKQHSPYPTANSAFDAEGQDAQGREGHGSERRMTGRALSRFLPAVAILGCLALGYAFGLQDYLSLNALADHRDQLQGFVAANFLLAAAAYLGVYALAVAVAFPAASVLTVFGGFLFGWLAGGALTAVAATTGATLLFLAARSTLGPTLRDRAGGSLARFADGFRKDAFSYLLILRLAPIFPFFLVNIAPAFFGVSTRTFVMATLIGILPGTFAYSYLGSGLDSVLVAASEAGTTLSLGDLVTPQITLAFAALAAVAAIPLIVKRVTRQTKT